MKEKQSSTTAEGMAIVRAIEAQKPEEARICYDPIARRLVNPMSVFLSKLTIDSGIYDRFFAPGGGAIEFIVARERYIDDFLRARLREGLDQVVILGAGFDTRAYRIAGIEKTRVFEVDHPATQAVKLKRLTKALGRLPAHVTFVALDFNTQKLEERLNVAGYRDKAKTLFIWQGVIMYLTPEAVDRTLAFITGHSGTGSSVIFDYFYTSTLQDLKLKTARRVTRMLGETLTFGVEEGKIGPFLESRRLSDVHDADAAELHRLYFTGPNARRIVKPGVAIASAYIREAVK